MRGHLRRTLWALLLCAAAVFVLAPAAGANHSAKDQISLGPSGGNGAVDFVFFHFSSADGSHAVFETPESLVPGDTDTAFDTYDRQGGTTTLVSTGPAGGNAQLDAYPDGISDDGSRIFFDTDEALVASDTDGLFDTYERSGGTTTLKSTGPAGGNGAFDAFYLDTSRDGTHVIFETDESLVAADTDAETDIYDRSGSTTTLLTIGPAGGNDPGFFPFLGGISDNANHVFFETDEQLVASDTDSFFDVYDRSGGTTTLVSTGPGGGNGNIDASYRGNSADGSRAYFQTTESLVAADTDTSMDVYERNGATTTLISTGPSGGNGAFAANFDANSGDGSRVLFHTKESLVAADTDASTDLYERAGGTTTLVSTGPAGGNGAFDVNYSGSSGTGTRVYFETREPLVAGDTDANFDVYDRANNSTTSQVSTGPTGGNAAVDSNLVGLSLDGTRAFFETTEALAASDTDGVNDLYERFNGLTTHISTGPTGGNAAIPAFFAGSSDDGVRVFFDSRENLTASDTDVGQRDIFVGDVAGYPRPKGATPTRFGLVPAYRQCTAPNRVHGPPLASQSCNPPVQESSQLTVGSPDANGATANSVGFAKYDVVVGAAGPPEDSDVLFNLNITDVRVQGGSLPDYTGELQATTTLRATDKANGPAGTESATVNDVPLSVTVPCASTVSTTIGSTCSVSTSFQALMPGIVVETKRSIWQLGKLQVNDGGPDGLVSTTPNTLFATQGVFVP